MLCFHSTSALSVASLDDDLVTAVFRLLSLVGKSDLDNSILYPLHEKELYYRLLMGPLGGKLVLINTKGLISNNIARAINYLKERCSSKISMEELAYKVIMAPSTFYRNFKQLTKISPLQYQKQLRLNEAKRLMLSRDFDVTRACYEVGYESPTQFSREYKKMFGQPPYTDIKKITSLKA